MDRRVKPDDDGLRGGVSSQTEHRDVARGNWRFWAEDFFEIFSRASTSRNPLISPMDSGLHGNRDDARGGVFRESWIHAPSA